MQVTTEQNLRISYIEQGLGKNNLDIEASVVELQVNGMINTYCKHKNIKVSFNPFENPIYNKFYSIAITVITLGTAHLWNIYQEFKAEDELDMFARCFVGKNIILINTTGHSICTKYFLKKRLIEEIKKNFLPNNKSTKSNIKVFCVEHLKA